MNNGDTDGKHRLFHVMVLMGGSLALGCGGLSNETPDGAGRGGTAGSASGGKGGSTTGGGDSATGGGGSESGGGGSAGNPVAGSGGSAGAKPDPPECPSASWDCTNDPPVCDGYGYMLPTGCECGGGHPLTPKDCEPGESFVCLLADHAADSTYFEEPVAFSCHCLPSESYCELLCDEVSAPGATCNEVMGPEGTTTLCGCAVIVLR